MSEKQTNFREMLDKVRFDRPDDQPPKSWGFMSKLVGVSKTHLFNLMNGKKSAPEWTVNLIANRLKVSQSSVEMALELSRTQSKTFEDISEDTEADDKSL